MEQTDLKDCIPSSEFERVKNVIIDTHWLKSTKNKPHQYIRRSSRPALCGLLKSYIDAYGYLMDMDDHLIIGSYIYWCAAGGDIYRTLKPSL